MTDDARALLRCALKLSEARVADLERQLDEAHAHIEFLKGETEAAYDKSGLTNVVEQLRSQHAAETAALREALDLLRSALPDSDTAGPDGTGYCWAWDECTNAEQEWVKSIREKVRALVTAGESGLGRDGGSADACARSAAHHRRNGGWGRPARLQDGRLPDVSAMLASPHRRENRRG